MSDEPRELQDFGWAVLELMGHRRLGGRVAEAELAGAKVLRIEVPDGDGFVTQFYGGAALFSLTPTSEEAARAVRYRPEPVHRWELPPSIPEPVDAGVIDEDDIPY